LSLLFFFGRSEQMRRRAARLPRTRIAEAPEGARIKIVGRLELMGEPLRGPLTQRPCAAWSIHLVEPPDEGRGATRRTRDALVGDFALRDESGARAIVRAAEAGAAAVAFEHDVDLYRDVHSEQYRQLRDHFRYEMDSLLFDGCRYSEAVLEPGEEITVVGVARREIDAEGTAAALYREPPMQLVFEATGDKPLVILDARKQ
jgi:hypothetical protein